MITDRTEEAGALAGGILVLPPGSCILRTRQRAGCPSLPRLDFPCCCGSSIRGERCRGGAKDVPFRVLISEHQPAHGYGVIRQSVFRVEPKKTSWYRGCHEYMKITDRCTTCRDFLSLYPPSSGSIVVFQYAKDNENRLGVLEEMRRKQFLSASDRRPKKKVFRISGARALVGRVFLPRRRRLFPKNHPYISFFFLVR